MLNIIVLWGGGAGNIPLHWPWSWDFVSSILITVFLLSLNGIFPSIYAIVADNCEGCNEQC